MLQHWQPQKDEQSQPSQSFSLLQATMATAATKRAVAPKVNLSLFMVNPFLFCFSLIPYLFTTRRKVCIKPLVSVILNK